MQQNQFIAQVDVGVERTLRRLSVRQCGVVLAVSGGADSMVLLTVLAHLRETLGLSLAVGTFDHGLRPESADEAALVTRYAATLGLEARTFRWHRDAAPAADTNLENAARQARYRALLEFRNALGMPWLATAHTASDQAETLLMRLVRGTSLAGAAGVHETRADGVLRPLLHLTRAEVERYAAEAQVPFVEDPMNREPGFLRVRMRQSVLPALNEAAGFQVAPALARFAAAAAEDDQALQSTADAAWPRVYAEGSLDRHELRALPVALARRVLTRFLAGQQLPIDAELIDECLRAVKEGTRATLPTDRLLECSTARLQVTPAPARKR